MLLHAINIALSPLLARVAHPALFTQCTGRGYTSHHMSRKSIFLLWAVVAFFVAIFHTLSISFYLYWMVPWTDSVIHLLGGVVVFIPFYLFFREKLGIWGACVAALAGLFAVDVAWETFEYVQGLTELGAEFWPDTLMDTASSFVGALLSFSLLACFEKSA